jgi:hypothetical protein
MLSSFFNVLGFAFIPVGTAWLGALIAVLRPPNAHVLSYIQHLAAGVVFAGFLVFLLFGMV